MRGSYLVLLCVFIQCIVVQSQNVTQNVTETEYNKYLALDQSTYFGNNFTYGNSAAISSNKNFYWLIGSTTDTDFAKNVSTNNFHGGSDVFISKMSVSTGVVSQNTFFGGSDYEWGADITISNTSQILYFVGTRNVAVNSPYSYNEYSLENSNGIFGTIMPNNSANVEYFGNNVTAYGISSYSNNIYIIGRVFFDGSEGNNFTAVMTGCNYTQEYSFLLNIVNGQFDSTRCFPSGDIGISSFFYDLYNSIETFVGIANFASCLNSPVIYSIGNTEDSMFCLPIIVIGRPLAAFDAKENTYYITGVTSDPNVFSPTTFNCTGYNPSYTTFGYLMSVKNNNITNCILDASLRPTSITIDESKNIFIGSYSSTAPKFQQKNQIQNNGGTVTALKVFSKDFMSTNTTLLSTYLGGKNYSVVNKIISVSNKTLVFGSIGSVDMFTTGYQLRNSSNGTTPFGMSSFINRFHETPVQNYYPPITVTVAANLNTTYHGCYICSTNYYVCNNETEWQDGKFTIDDPRIGQPPRYEVESVQLNTLYAKYPLVASSVTMSLLGTSFLTVVRSATFGSYNCDGSCDLPNSGPVVMINAVDKPITEIFINSSRWLCAINYTLTFTLQYVPPPVPTTGITLEITTSEPNQQSSSDNGFKTWMIGVIAGLAFLILLVIISMVIFLVVKNKRAKQRRAERERQREIEMINRGPYGTIGSDIQFGAPLSNYQSSSVIDSAAIVERVLGGTDSKYDIPAKELIMESELGRGAFGTVYKGKWRATPVAVKRLKSDNLTEHQIEEFLQEANIMMSLKNHPNVVTFLGICANPLCLITELLENGSLDKYLYNKANEIDYALQIKLVRGIAAGMHHLQCENLVHKDLAARNILLNKDMSPKVSDFGLSRLRDSSQEVIYSKTDTGPLKWMAPESLNKKQYSVKSDVWSFGITVIEIFTRKSPYPELDLMEFTKLIIGNGLRPIEYLPRNECSETLYQLIAACFNHDPSARPDFVQIIEILDSTTV